jgi:flagellar biosynthesis chaperone FliJ
MQQYTRSDINQLNQDIDAKKQQIADDEKAIEDLHDQLRHEGGDPGWLR